MNQFFWAIAFTLLVDIILPRLTGTRKGCLRENRGGFRSSRGCIDRNLTSGAGTFRRPVTSVFLHLKVAFDLVGRAVPWSPLSLNVVLERLTSLIQSLYANSQSRVYACGGVLHKLTTRSGVR